MNSMLHNRKRVLLTGNCKYELTGLHHLLTDIGCEVMYQGIPGSGQYDLIVIALSAEPLAGENIFRISENCTQVCMCQ